jgi:hypothetical protein
MIFEKDQSIPLALLEPAKVIGLPVMYPIRQYADEPSEISVTGDKLLIQSEVETRTGIWFGGFNPFATYIIDLASVSGEGDIGFEFSDAEKTEQFIITLGFNNSTLTGVTLRVLRNSVMLANEPIAINPGEEEMVKGSIILQMLGSGLVLYTRDKGLPKAIAQSDFNRHIDLRRKFYIHSFQSSLYLHLKHGAVQVNKVESALTTGIGLADIRAITYENGDPLLDQGRLWYTMSIRGRALPHHLQGVFSMDPTVFDIRLEGIILFDRSDGLLRNEIASHIYYDRRHDIWRGLTTGFSAFANPESEKK